MRGRLLLAPVLLSEEKQLPHHSQKEGKDGAPRESIKLISYSQQPENTAPDPDDRCRRHAVGEQHLLRARHRQFHFIRQSSALQRRAGTPEAERGGARTHRQAWLRTAQFYS